MKLKLLLVFSLLITFNSFAQNFEWVRTFANSTNNDFATKSAVDKQGNIYTVGRFWGTTDFDNGPGVYNVTSISNHDGYVTKISSTGVLQWVKAFGGYSVRVDIKGIVVDASNNICLTGNFAGAVDFDPNAGTQTFLAPSEDVFIVKLDASGNYLWATSFPQTNFQTSNGITVDQFSNIYIAGAYENTIDFDSSVAGVQQMSSNANSQDVFVLKVNSNGDFQWVRGIGGGSIEEAKSITTDSLNNVLVTGVYKSTVDFNPGTAVNNMTAAGNNDAFVLKLDATGAFVWSKSLGGTYDDTPYCIKVDKAGNVFTVGNFIGTADFNPGTETYNLTGSIYYTYPFISKLNSAGQFVWAKTFLDATASSMCIDGSGNVFVSGIFSGGGDFNPGSPVFSLTNYGGSYGDLYISKFNNSGDFVWAAGIGGISMEEGVSLDCDISGKVFLTGNFYSTVDFAPGSGQVNYTSLGGYDGFVLKLNQDILLPLNHIMLKAIKLTSGVINLSWETDQTASGFFDIERSSGGRAFSYLYTISSDDERSYAYTDNYPYTAEQSNYYRIKYMNPDGKTIYSNITHVNGLNTRNLAFYPNPANTLLSFAEKCSGYTLFDGAGNRLASGNFTSPDAMSLNVASYNPGIYVLELRLTDGSIKAEKLIIAR